MLQVGKGLWCIVQVFAVVFVAISCHPCQVCCSILPSFVGFACLCFRDVLSDHPDWCLIQSCSWSRPVGHGRSPTWSGEKYKVVIVFLIDSFHTCGCCNAVWCFAGVCCSSQRPFWESCCSSRCLTRTCWWPTTCPWLLLVWVWSLVSAVLSPLMRWVVRLRSTILQFWCHFPYQPGPSRMLLLHYIIGLVVTLYFVLQSRCCYAPFF